MSRCCDDRMNPPGKTLRKFVGAVRAGERAVTENGLVGCSGHLARRPSGAARPRPGGVQVVLAAAVVVGVAGCTAPQHGHVADRPAALSSSDAIGSTPTPLVLDPAAGQGPAAASAALRQLPRGGRVIFPRYRVVAFYGAGTTPGLGVLGRGTPDHAATRLAGQAAEYAGFGRPVLPCLELVTTLASAFPGRDGRYSTRTPASVVRRYLTAARAHRMILMLDFQPGRGDFLSQVKAYDVFLGEPDVSIAVDPEWKMTPTQVPGKVIGHADANQINPVIDHVAGIVKQGKLPQKLFVIHQFTRFMIGHRSRLQRPPGLAVTFHIDGFGGRAVKISKYRALAPKATSGYHAGFKLFYRADTNLMTPATAMALRPRPDMVSYQ